MKELVLNSTKVIKQQKTDTDIPIHTFRESTAAYIMSIQPLKVAYDIYNKKNNNKSSIKHVLASPPHNFRVLGLILSLF